jgi:hypothetical protein
VVVGTVLGAAVAVKMGWRRMWAAVTRKSSKSDPVDPQGEPVASKSRQLKDD